MVKLLLRIVGINRFVVNKASLTAFDIVRENIEYHESNRIIAVLSNYPSKHEPFLYCPPKVSAEKHEVAIKMVNETFEARHNTELVVAVMLETMSFTAAFTIPGSFVTDVEKGKEDTLGSSILLGLASFKLFLIFDCAELFLSLFVVLMWQMSTPITMGNKILFLFTTNQLVCASFSFTMYGFMAAVYAMLDNRDHDLAWLVRVACLTICCCGNLTFFYMATKFCMVKARFSHLNGLNLFLTDRVRECMWMKLQRWRPLDSLHLWKTKWLAIFYCNFHKQETEMSHDDKTYSGTNKV